MHVPSVLAKNSILFVCVAEASAPDVMVLPTRSVASHAQGLQSATHSSVYDDSVVTADQLRPVAASCAVVGHAPGSSLRANVSEPS